MTGGPAGGTAVFIVEEELLGESHVRLKVKSSAGFSIGTRETCDLTVDDPIAADKHSRILYDGSRFLIEDCRSATGTYRNGIAVRSPTPLAAGDAIILGATRFTVISLSKEEGLPAIRLSLKERGFFFKEGGSGFFEGDRDLWVYSEVGLGRFPALLALNRLALILAVGLPFLLLVDRIEEPLLEPGLLTGSHAQLFTGSRPPSEGQRFQEVHPIASKLGCESCHDPWQATPMSRCAQCHGRLMSGHHPFKSTPASNLDVSKVSREWDEADCRRCHVDHRGTKPRQGGFVPTAEQTAAACDTCHGGTELARKGYPPERPVVPRERRQRPYSTFRFGHKDHLNLEGGKSIPCRKCHEDDPVVVENLHNEIDVPSRRDFLPVPFKTCARCHAKEHLDEGLKEFWPRKAENIRNVAWHGSEDAEKTCGRCHDPAKASSFRKVKRFALKPEEFLALKAQYSLVSRSHQDMFQKHEQGKECTECHRRGERLLALDAEAKRIFWHEAHLRKLPPEEGARRQVSDECLRCHKELDGSNGLLAVSAADFSYRCDTVNCGTCHQENGSPLNLKQIVTAREGFEKVRVESRTDFPHHYHLNFTAGGPLADGCFACHDFERAGEGAWTLIPRTSIDAANCRPCHDRHQNVGGGSCTMCHPMDDPKAYNVYLGENPPPERRQPTRLWPEENGFNHHSPGHAETGCQVCHLVGKGGSLDLGLASTLEAVPIPDEGYEDPDPELRAQKLNVCRKCHLATKKRFHWR